MAYGEPVEIDDIDLNSQWISDTTDDEYNYFKSDSYDVDTPFSQCKVTWSNLTSVTFKYMSNSDMSDLFVGNLDGNKFTLETNPDEEVYQSTIDKTPGIYNEFTIECDEGEHHIWFCYAKMEGATDEDRGFIGVSKYVSPVIDVKQGAELPTEYKSGGVSVEGGKTYGINFNNVTVPNGNIVPSYEDFQKVEKTITYEYVNLGLPSGLKWATCNIGATSETESGVFFQWGETSGISGSLVGKYSDENYSWASYTHCNGSSTTLTKYTATDNKTTLETVDDAATQIMGDGWRMPTQTEFQELYKNTNQKWVKDYNGSGVNGRKFTSKTDESKYIFIPAAGTCSNGSYSTSNVGKYGHIWSSSLYTSKPDSAWNLYFSSNDYSMTAQDQNRYHGYCVRGVHA